MTYNISIAEWFFWWNIRCWAPETSTTGRGGFTSLIVGFLWKVLDYTEESSTQMACCTVSVREVCNPHVSTRDIEDACAFVWAKPVTCWNAAALSWYIGAHEWSYICVCAWEGFVHFQLGQKMSLTKYFVSEPDSYVIITKIRTPLIRAVIHYLLYF